LDVIAAQQIAASATSRSRPMSEVSGRGSETVGEADGEGSMKPLSPE
jgi:hypothetical protein